MKRIILISDTHSFLGEDVSQYFADCDEIWHAGDIGKIELTEHLKSYGKTLRVVYGNIDTGDLRQEFPKDLWFECEGVKVFMTHIGGYPGRYTKRVHKLLKKERPDLYICGHSHILKVMPDRELNILHMNPGACGLHGFHKFRTFLRFSCHESKVQDVEAIDLGLRGLGFKVAPAH
jgi:putative phosphoesterase